MDDRTPGHFWRITLLTDQYDAMTKLKKITSPLTPLNSFKLELDQDTIDSPNVSVWVSGINSEGDDNNPGVAIESTLGNYTPNFLRIYLTMDQYNAMKYIKETLNPANLLGFRLYPNGRWNDPESIVVRGIGSSNSDILNTEQPYTSVEPCPPCCDCVVTQGKRKKTIKRSHKTK